MSSDAKTLAYQKGVQAEDMAAQMFERKGFEILQRRYKTKYGEVDVIAAKEGLLVFAEVKARKTIEEALEAISAQARQRIQNAALYFLSTHEAYASYDMRFDVVAVGQNQSGAISVSHLDNAWLCET